MTSAAIMPSLFYRECRAAAASVEIGGENDANTPSAASIACRRSTVLKPVR